MCGNSAVAFLSPFSGRIIAAHGGVSGRLCVSTFSVHPKDETREAEIDIQPISMRVGNHSSQIVGAKFLTDNCICSVAADEIVKLWSLDCQEDDSHSSLTLLRSFQIHVADPQSLQYSPVTGVLLVTGAGFQLIDLSDFTGQ